MKWMVIFDEAFAVEFAALPRYAQTVLLAKAPLGKFRAATRASSCGYAEGFEARKYEGVALRRSGRRAAFAFDVLRQAIVLVAGDKSAEGQVRFYRTRDRHGGPAV